jgi:hypothetical protein
LGEFVVNSIQNRQSLFCQIESPPVKDVGTTLHSQHPTPNANANAQHPTPNAQRPTPNANGQRPTPNGQRPTVIRPTHKLMLKLSIIIALHFAASLFSAIFAACE